MATKKKKLKQKKLYKTIVIVEVLSEERIPEMDLVSLHNEIHFEHASGLVKYGKPTILKGKEAVRATRKQGSDEEFFMMDKNGNELEEE